MEAKVIFAYNAIIMLQRNVKILQAAHLSKQKAITETIEHRLYEMEIDCEGKVGKPKARKE